MSIGTEIKKRREEKGLTQAELAKEVGCDRTNITHYEIGNKVPTVPMGKAIAKVLGCTVDDLAKDC